jgi:hypothetical protein
LLTHPTLDLLHQLGLKGMAKAFAEVEASAEATTLTHPEWLALLLDQEASYRRDRRLHFRLRYARLRHQAAVEDIAIAPHEVSIAPSSRSSQKAPGSTRMRT